VAIKKYQNQPSKTSQVL